MIQERYRQDYDGEFVIVNTIFRDGKKIQEREWIPNPVENQHISGRAVVICDTKKILSFDPTRLKNHKGGLLGKKKLQTYGVDRVHKTTICDFLVSFDKQVLTDIVQSNYDERNIVYTSSVNCIKNPGHFYLVPHGVLLTSIATACFLAAFDGHQEVFLINFQAWENNKEIENCSSVFSAYKGTKFFVVSTNDQRPSNWRSHSNVDYMYIDDWISYCDV